VALIKKAVKKVTKKPELDIKVKNIESSSIKLARCCSPVHGEPITGYITSGKGITVHSLRCPLVKKEILPSQRMVEVSWDKPTKSDYEASLLIKALDTPGVLAKITSKIACLQINIKKANVEASPDKKTRVNLQLTVKNIEQLEKALTEINGIPEVLSVERL
jgi:guanosine-3',5'-bis(diphosphate) 3'-pyrophosphohydrolase